MGLTEVEIPSRTLGVTTFGVTKVRVGTSTKELLNRMKELFTQKKHFFATRRSFSGT